MSNFNTGCLTVETYWFFVNMALLRCTTAAFTITRSPAGGKETKCDQPLSRRLCIIHQYYIGIHIVGLNRAGIKRTQL